MRLACLQLKGGIKDKEANVQYAISKIEEAVREHKARIVVLPEWFSCPFSMKYFREYGETIPDGYTSQKLSQLAKQLNIYIVGGTIPELREDGKLYNTCPIFDPNGDLIAKHSKMHLFDVDIKGGICFKESDTLTPGNEFTIIEVDGHKIGIGICYDIRFEEMAKVYRNAGCEVLIYPAAFNMTTGPLHWELLQRARATDNQVYVATASPSRDVNAGYVAFGHSMVVNPWGKVVESAKEEEAIVAVDLDFELVEQVRKQIPIFIQRRGDLYSTVKK